MGLGGHEHVGNNEREDTDIEGFNDANGREREFIFICVGNLCKLDFL